MNEESRQGKTKRLSSKDYERKTEVGRRMRLMEKTSRRDDMEE